MQLSRVRRLTAVGAITTLVATMLALVATVMPSADAAPGKVPDGTQTFTTLAGRFDIGTGGISLPIRHPDSPNECEDGVDNEVGLLHGGSELAPGIPTKDGLVDYSGSGVTGYAESNAGEATAGGLDTFPRGCTSGSDDLELFGHTYGVNPSHCTLFTCNNGLVLPDPQVRSDFAITADVVGNAVTIPSPASVQIPPQMLLFGSCIGSLCPNYFAQVSIVGNNNEVQGFNIDATGGTFTLTYDGQTTAAIARNATAPTVRTALEALSNLAPGDISVYGGVGADGGKRQYRIEFTGPLAATDVVQVTADGSALTGGGATATTTTHRQGGANMTGTANNDGSGSLQVGLDVILSLYKTIDSASLAPTTATCRTSIELDLTTGTSGALTGTAFDTTRENLQMVDGQFTMPPFAEAAGATTDFPRLVCDGANDAMGLWDSNQDPSNVPGDNEVVISASTDAGPWDVAGTDVVAAAGSDQIVDECDAVTVDGSTSFNDAFSQPTVEWTQLSGPAVTGSGAIEGADQLVASFVAPEGDAVVDMDLSYTTLIGPHPDNTRNDLDSVEITVNNVAPVAGAGADFATTTGKPAVPLSGFADDACTETPDLVTTWSQTGGPAVPIASPASLSTTFDTSGLVAPATLTFQLEVDDGTTSTTDTVVVDVRLASPGTLAGHVEDSGGTDLSGIDARVYLPGSGFQTLDATDGSGNWSVPGLSDGTDYAVLFNDPVGTHQSVWFRDSTNWDDRELAKAPDSAVDGVLVTEANGASLSGTVTNASTGAPLSGVTVALHDENGAGFVWDDATNMVVRGQDTTDGSGNWTIDGLNPGGQYRVRYQLSGYTEQWYDGRQWGWTATDISVVAGDALTGIDGALTPLGDRATLSGTVTDGDTGTNEIQTITVTSGSTRSMYDITYGGETIVAEATQPALALQDDLETLPGLGGNVAVTGSPGSYTVEFVGSLAKTDVAQLAVASRSERQSLRVSATGGTFTLDYDGQVTAAIAFNATPAAVQTALEALSNLAPGDVTVTGGVGDRPGNAPYTIEFGGTLAAVDVVEIIPNSASLTGSSTQGASVETIAGGSTVGSATTTAGVAETPLAGVEVRAYSATKGKYVLLDDTSLVGAYAMSLPLDTYRIRFVDPVNGKVWEWYDNLRTPDAADPAYLVSNTVDLSTASASATVDASLNT